MESPSPQARIRGELLTQWPKDLFIPPEALEVFLEAFEGPLDLLLYLIRKQKLDILDLPIMAITEQYMEYIAVMESMRFELAAEYLVMAATLAEIKSRLLLPRSVSEDETEEEDPRLLLIKQLQAYEVIKNAATALEDLPQQGRDFWYAQLERTDELQPKIAPPEVSLSELLKAISQVVQRSEYLEHHQIEREALSTRERMSLILDILSTEHFSPFHTLFTPEEGRAGVVVSFLAILELTKEQLIELQQASSDGQIYVRARA